MFTIRHLFDWRPAMRSTALLRMIPTEISSIYSVTSILNLYFNFHSNICLKVSSCFTCTHHGVCNNVDSVSDVENFKVFKLRIRLVFPLNTHLPKTLVNIALARNIEVKCKRLLTVSDI